MMRKMTLPVWKVAVFGVLFFLCSYHVSGATWKDQMRAEQAQRYRAPPKPPSLGLMELPSVKRIQHWMEVHDAGPVNVDALEKLHPGEVADRMFHLIVEFRNKLVPNDVLYINQELKKFLSQIATLDKYSGDYARSLLPLGMKLTLEIMHGTFFQATRQFLKGKYAVPVMSFKEMQQKPEMEYLYLIMDVLVEAGVLLHDTEDMAREFYMHIDSEVKVTVLEYAVYFGFRKIVAPMAAHWQQMSPVSFVEGLWSEYGLLRQAARNADYGMMMTLLTGKAYWDEDTSQKTLDVLVQQGRLSQVEYGALMQMIMVGGQEENDDNDDKQEVTLGGSSSSESSSPSVGAGGWDREKYADERIERFLSGLSSDLPCLWEDVDMEDVARMELLVRERRPFRVKGAGSDTFLLADMSRDVFVDKYGARQVHIGRIPYENLYAGLSSASNMTLQGYVEYLDEVYADEEARQQGTIPLYAFSAGFFTHQGTSLHDVTQLGSTLSSLLTVATVDTSRVNDQMSIGPRGSGAPFHHHCSAFNILGYGEKHWFLQRPSDRMIGAMHPLEYLEQNSPSNHCIQDAHDFVYVPAFWGHAVLNAQHDTVGMAIELGGVRTHAGGQLQC